MSVGLQGRALRVSMVIAPIVMVSYVIGLPYGPAGVALAFSAGMTLVLIPCVLWCLHGTVVSPKDLFVATIRPVLGGLGAAALAWAVVQGIGQFPSPIVRLLAAGGLMMAAYTGIVLFVMGQMKFYSDLFRALLGQPKPKTSPPKTSPVIAAIANSRGQNSQYPESSRLLFDQSFAVQSCEDINGGIGIKPRF
jgi:PST family polysaccharide transporter